MTQVRSEETHSRILSTALALFAQQGFDATGVAEICAAAEVSKGAFYHHFPSKQAVYLTLLQDWIGGVETWLETVRRQSPSAPVALLEMSSVVGQVFRSASGQLPMFLEFWTRASRDREVWRETIAPYHRFQEFFSALIRQGVDEGSLRPVDPDAAARLVLSLAVGVIFQGLLDPHGADWEAAIQDGLGVLLDNWKT